eukprot:4788988-Prymnesium_polylepis.1
MGRIPSGTGSARSSSRCTRALLPRGARRGRQEPRAWRQPCASRQTSRPGRDTCVRSRRTSRPGQGACGRTARAQPRTTGWQASTAV